jgi:hypothetical protein
LGVSNPEWTHDLLVQKAGWWLRERLRCFCVMQEPGFGACPERPDAIGWKHGVSHVIECKATRSDFLSDKNKEHRTNDAGMGQYRYYMAPRGIIRPEEIPAGWGYLELRGRATGRVFKVIEPEIREANLLMERLVLIGALSNVQMRARGFFIPTGKWQHENIGKSPKEEYWNGYDRGRESGLKAAERERSA